MMEKRWSDATSRTRIEQYRYARRKATQHPNSVVQQCSYSTGCCRYLQMNLAAMYMYYNMSTGCLVVLQQRC